MIGSWAHAIFHLKASISAHHAGTCRFFIFLGDQHITLAVARAAEFPLEPKPPYARYCTWPRGPPTRRIHYFLPAGCRRPPPNGLINLSSGAIKQHDAELHLMKRGFWPNQGSELAAANPSPSSSIQRCFLSDRVVLVSPRTDAFVGGAKEYCPMPTCPGKKKLLEGIGRSGCMLIHIPICVVYFLIETAMPWPLLKATKTIAIIAGTCTCPGVTLTCHLYTIHLRTEDDGPCMHLAFSFFSFFLSFFPATAIVGPETGDRFKDRVGANVIAHHLD
jgi:hypothetical protein